MKFIVKYKATHVREFTLPDRHYLETILSAENGYEIVSVEEADE